MYTEDDLLPISALQHLMFCERQWALIHLEQVWRENVLTAEGRKMHERVHEVDSETRGDVRTARGLRIHSYRLGLSGQADVVEFHRVSETNAFSQLNQQEDKAPAHEEAVALPGVKGLWKPSPVEYKRGKPKRGSEDEVQLCAQAMCLEEMLGCRIAEGAFFYGQTRRRLAVAFSETLRSKTETLAARLHELWREGITPSARYEKKCDSCSLIEVCQPKTVAHGKSAKRYFAAMLRDSVAEPEEIDE